MIIYGTTAVAIVIVTIERVQIRVRKLVVVHDGRVRLGRDDDHRGRGG